MKRETQHTKSWDAAKAVLRKKFIAINAYFKKKKKEWENEQTNLKLVKGRKL